MRDAAAEGEVACSSEDRLHQLEHVRGGRWARVHERAAAADDRLGELGKVVFADSQRAQRREAGEPRELLRALGGTPAEECVRDELGVEAERRRQAERVQRTVREAVAAADRLRHRVAEREARARERLARLRRAAEELLARSA